jgi:hypothetical protein
LLARYAQVILLNRQGTSNEALILDTENLVIPTVDNFDVLAVRTHPNDLPLLIGFPHIILLKERGPITGALTWNTEDSLMVAEGDFEAFTPLNMSKYP